MRRRRRALPLIRTVSELETELRQGREESLRVEIGGKDLRLTHLDKVYFPEPGYTKRDILAYYYRVADRILPFLEDRPLVLHRFPNGIEGESFYQNDIGEGVPEWIETVVIPSEQRARYALLRMQRHLDAAAHGEPRLHRAAPLAQPRRRPGAAGLRLLRPRPQRGLRVQHRRQGRAAVPEDTRELGSARRPSSRRRARAAFICGCRSSASTPTSRRGTSRRWWRGSYTTSCRRRRRSSAWSTSVRKGRSRWTTAQNSYGKPLATVYSVRPKPQATVSAPLTARELSKSLRPEKYTIETLPPALARRRKDPWRDFWKRRQRIESALEVLRDGLRE